MTDPLPEFLPYVSKHFASTSPPPRYGKFHTVLQSKIRFFKLHVDLLDCLAAKLFLSSPELFPEIGTAHGNSYLSQLSRFLQKAPHCGEG